MHTIAPEDIHRSPVPIRTTMISLDIQLYGVCGRQSRKTLQQINQNMQTLLNAGNRPLSKQEKQGDDEMTYDNRLQQILNTKLTRINAFICGDEGVAHADRQYSTWVAAGLMVQHPWFDQSWWNWVGSAAARVASRASIRATVGPSIPFRQRAHRGARPAPTPQPL